jgi:DNA-binding transcriptional MocR family regulator
VKGFYLMPNCHNPTGTTVSAERRRGLVAWSRASAIPLIEDDYGASLDLDGEAPPPALRAMDGDVIYVSTFSKKLVPALRLGFIVCPPGLKSTLSSMKRVMDLGTSALIQFAVAEFLDRGYLRAHMNRTLPEYRSRRDALESSLRAHLPAGIGWNHPSRGVVLWVRLPPALDPDVVFEEAFRRGVQVSPGTLWSFDDSAERGIRLAFCAESPARLAEGAKRLGQTLQVLLQRTPRARAEREAMIEVV